jgi:hypothetical protein
MRAIVLLAFACGAGQRPAGGRVGVHGMVVMGRDHVFMSHIPMLMAPHDVQLVIEVGGVPAADRDEPRTFQPHPFSLDDLRSGALTTFTGDLYRGNFEAGGEVIARDVRVSVKRIVHSALLDGHDGPAGADYLAVGDGYAVHVLRTKADVDRVVHLRDPAAAGAIVREPAVDAELSCLVPPDYAAACR